MARCPNCCQAMTTQAVEARVAVRPVEVDACPDCRLFWFDQWESTSLAPRAVLGLFQYIGGAAGSLPKPLASRFNCTRCEKSLDFTYDLQRNTAFTYWRCSMGHGRLISFNQFLREKNFIRTPSPAELARLRETVRQIACSQCGAPVDLATASACAHCGAPIALVDPDSVAKAIRELAAPQPGTPGAGVPDPRYQALLDAHIEALFNQERASNREQPDDLLQVGAAAIAGLIGALLLPR